MRETAPKPEPKSCVGKKTPEKSAEPVPSKDKTAPTRYRASKAALIPYTSPDYAAFDMRVSDQKRADVWLKDFQEFVRKGNLPALEILHLPRDHTAGARPGWNTPKACFAAVAAWVITAPPASIFWAVFSPHTVGLSNRKRNPTKLFASPELWLLFRNLKLKCNHIRVIFQDLFVIL